MLRKALAVMLAAVTALTVWTSNPQPAEARNGAGIAIGVAAAVLGAALIYNATRPRYRYAYRPYRPVYAGYYYARPRYYAPRRYVVRRYYGPRRVVYRSYRRW